MENFEIIDLQPQIESFEDHVLDALSRRPLKISSKFLYDQRGALLFDQICQQPEYYPTNAELEILGSHASALLDVSTPINLIELGSGHSRKIQCLLGALCEESVYLPIDISFDYLKRHAEAIAAQYPTIQVKAICADFLQNLVACSSYLRHPETLLFFPGSTLGNFEPNTQINILQQMRSWLGPKAKMLIGLDSKNDPTILEAAYNDAAGKTADFELNMIQRFRQELALNLRVEDFIYRGFYNASQARIEMYVECSRDVDFEWKGQHFKLKSGERIHLENSYKFDSKSASRLAAAVGMTVGQEFWDSSHRFCIYRFVP